VKDPQGRKPDQALVGMHSRGQGIDTEGPDEKSQAENEEKNQNLRRPGPDGGWGAGGGKGKFPPLPKGGREKQQADPKGQGFARLGKEGLTQGGQGEKDQK